MTAGDVPKDGEASWETSPAFLALSNRIAKTESTLAGLVSTVDDLSRKVAFLSSAPHATRQNPPKDVAQSESTSSIIGSIGSIASDDDARVTPGRQGSYTAGAIGDQALASHQSVKDGHPTLLNGDITAEPPADDGNLVKISANSDNIAALMQRVSALSMSVAQLQKIQTNQVQLTRSNSGSAPASGVAGLTASSGINAGAAAGAGSGTGDTEGATTMARAPNTTTGVDRTDATTPTPGAGAVGARTPTAGARGGAGIIGGGYAGSTTPGSLSRPAAPTQLGMGLTSSTSGPMTPNLLSPPLSATSGPAGRRIEQAHRPGMGRSISSSMINSHLTNPGAGGMASPSGAGKVGEGDAGASAPGSRWPGHGYGPLSPAPPSMNASLPSGSGGKGPVAGPGGRMGGPPGHLQMPSLSLGMAERVWSPGAGAMGPMMTPRVEITQSAAMGTPGQVQQGQGQGQGGAATPGAGIVVTKWDHLNLKPDLLRGIAKYGIGPPNKIQARVLPFMLRGSDIIAQAPPTQERIIAYVIPSLQICLSHMSNGQYRGPTVVIVTTTVDQATQCHKLVRNIGGPLGIRSALVAGVAGSSNIQNEIAAVQRDQVHLLIGTPAKLNEVVTARGPMGGADCRLLVLDEVDQLIARNLYDHVLSIAKFLPAPRRGPGLTPGAGAGAFSSAIERVTSPYDAGQSSPFNPNSKTPFPGQQANARFGAGGGGAGAQGQNSIERQTCIFSNTIPTDVINFSQSLSVRDPVRVLVRRDGGPNSQESVSSVTPGINLKHTYVYLTITGSAAGRVDASATNADGLGAIGSGRSNPTTQGGQSEEANRAKEYKLDILTKLLDDYPMWQAIVHVGTFSMLEAVVYKLQSRSWETTYLAPDMPAAQKKAVLQQWRMSSPMQGGPRFMVIFDVNVKPPEIPWAPLVINFDLPRSVEGYAARAAAGVPPGGRGGAVAYQQQVLPGAVTSMSGPTPGQSQGQQGLLQGPGQGQQVQGQSQNHGQGPGQNQQGQQMQGPAQGQNVFGVVVSFVQAAGGDVEMLRSTECAYRFKRDGIGELMEQSAEIPSVFHDLF